MLYGGYMNNKEAAEKIIKKLAEDKSFKASFEKDRESSVKDVLGKDLSPEEIQSIIKLVKSEKIPDCLRPDSGRLSGFSGLGKLPD